MTTTATGTTYTIDPTHSEIGFSISHLMISKVRGNFTGFEGTVDLGGNGLVPTKLQGSLQAASVSTRVEQRDQHLRSADFFDVENFPAITFVSTSITGSDKTFSVTGNLTIKGQTQSVTLDGEVGGQTTDPWGNDRIAFNLTGKVKRADFGIVFGSGMLGEDVKLDLEIQAIHKA